MAEDRHIEDLGLDTGKFDAVTEESERGGLFSWLELVYDRGNGQLTRFPPELLPPTMMFSGFIPKEDAFFLHYLRIRLSSI